MKAREKTLLGIGIIIIILILIVTQISPQNAVLIISLTPTTTTIQPYSLPEPPQTYTINTEAKLTGTYELQRDGQYAVSTGLRDWLKENFNITILFTVNIAVYGNNDTQLFTAFFTFDGGFTRTIRVYDSDFVANQPLKVVIDIHLEVIKDGTVIITRDFHIEKTGITLQ